MGFGAKDQIDAMIPILTEMGVDVTPVQTLFQKAIYAGQSDVEGQRALEKQAVQAAARLMEQAFREQMAPLREKATRVRINQADVQVKQAKAAADSGRLTEAVLIYRQAQKILKGS
ncbi:MAG: hypothetical protein GX934_06890 [Burkholderiales bacterium]|nr:hypothetical protein [Burkholderiales bacterium]